MSEQTRDPDEDQPERTETVTTEQTVERTEPVTEPETREAESSTETDDDRV